MTIDINAPLAGNIWEILVAPGDAVEDGDMVIILEALKMETPVETHVSGRVKEIYVQEGDVVDDDQPLLSIETD